jgi:hypothetical protein
MIYTALRATMICQACGLDKQKKELLVDKSSFFVALNVIKGQKSG